MTKVSRLFEEEKLDAVNKIAAQTAKQIITSMTLELLKDDVDILSIMKYTKLPKDEILQIKNQMQSTAVN